MRLIKDVRFTELLQSIIDSNLTEVKDQSLIDCKFTTDGHRVKDLSFHGKNIFGNYFRVFISGKVAMYDKAKNKIRWEQHYWDGFGNGITPEMTLNKKNKFNPELNQQSIWN